MSTRPLKEKFAWLVLKVAERYFQECQNVSAYADLLVHLKKFSALSKPRINGVAKISTLSILRFNGSLKVVL
jgi:hypothetical protein